MECIAIDTVERQSYVSLYSYWCGWTTKFFLLEFFLLEIENTIL